MYTLLWTREKHNQITGFVQVPLLPITSYVKRQHQDEIEDLGPSTKLIRALNFPEKENFNDIKKNELYKKQNLI